MDIAEKIHGKLIVACHPDPAMGLPEDAHIDALVRAVEAGGAGGIRVEGVENVRRVRGNTALPIIAFVSGSYPDGSRLITPGAEDAAQLADAGADIVAIDGTNRKRPSGDDGFSVVERVKSTVAVPLWCDVSTFQEGIRCAELGADMVATTLSGFTPETASKQSAGPDWRLVAELSSSLVIPVIMEGRVLTLEDAAAAIDAGAWAVVAGTAITRPSMITKMFVSSLNQQNWSNF